MLTCSDPDPNGYSCSQPGLSIGDCQSPDPPLLPGGSYLQRGIKGMAKKPDYLGRLSEVEVNFCFEVIAEHLCFGCACQAMLPEGV